MTAYRPKLLIVDDDVSTVRIISEILADYGDRRFALSGEMGLLLAKDSTPDVILLDASMPGMTGFDFCEILKADNELAKVPVIFVTSHDAPALEVDAFRLGAADYVTKPLNAIQLRARVEAQLRSRLRLQGCADSIRDGSFLPATFGVAPDNILVIDSDASRNIELTHLLDDTGGLTFAPTADQGIELARTSHPTLILVSVALDGACGLQLCASLRREPRLAGTPIFLLSPDAEPHAEHEQALLEGLADSVLTPAEPAVLKARVRTALAAAHQEQRQMGSMRESWLALERARVASRSGDETSGE